MKTTSHRVGFRYTQAELTVWFAVANREDVEQGGTYPVLPTLACRCPWASG
jgi:hypothetical protein